MVEGNEDPFCVFRLLESPHSCESCIEVTDVGFQTIGGMGNARINEVHEGKAAGFFEAQENVVVDGVDTEDIRFDDALQMLPAQEESLWGGMKEKLAVTEQDPFLFVPGMIAESLELQSGLEISEQMDMAPLYRDAIGLQYLCEPWQAINRGCREDHSCSQKLLQKVIEDLRRFLAGAQSALQESCSRVPDQMLAVFLPADAERLAVEDKNTAWLVWICKDSTLKIVVQSTHHGCVLLAVLCVSHPTICASVKHVAIMEDRSRFPASAVDSERV